MVRTFWLRGVLCVGTLSLLIGASAWQKRSSATTLCTETEIAGISLSLNKYYETSIAEESAAKAAEEEKRKEAEEEAEKKAEEKTTVEEKKSEYDNIGISIANDYVNIRKSPNTHSKIKGKLYKGCAAEILKTEGKKWVKIKSGNVKGYINKDYLAIGFSAEELVDKYAKKKAKVTTETLFVRQRKSTESTILTMIPEDEVYTVIEEEEHWAKIRVDDTKGYVKKDYVKITAEFKEAISIKEERAKIRAKRKAEKAAAAARAKAEAELEQARAEREAQQKAAAASANNSSSNSTSQSSGSSSSNVSSGNGASSISVGAGTGSEVASYAQNFVGNPYVYGGTSLTNGTDCSGFTQSVYSHFGYSIPRTSSAQSGYGKSVSLDTDSLRAGDLIFYTSGGRVNHVAMYIGGGQVVHASNEDDGIKISNWKYRTPYCARRIIY